MSLNVSRIIIALALWASSICIVPSVLAEPNQDHKMQEFLDRVNTAYACRDREEYLCAAYNFSLAVETGASFNDDERNKALLIDFAKSIYLQDKQVLLGLVDEDDTLAVSLTEWNNNAWLDMENGLQYAREVLVEANHRNSYLYVGISFDLLKKLDGCDSETFGITDDIFRVLSDANALKDVDEYDRDVEEVTMMEARKLGVKIVGCVF